MNYWGLAFCGMWILAFILFFFVLWLDEREEARQQERVRAAFREMAAGMERDTTYLDDYKRR